MSSEWSRFTSALESKGRSFESVRFASEPVAIIKSLGILDPVDIAIIETEWRSRVQPQATHLANTSQPTRKADPLEGGGEATIHTHQQRYHDNLHVAPAAIQDTVLAFEVLGALLGRGGSFFLKTGDSFSVTGRVPPAMRAAVEGIIPIADCFLGLLNSSHMELTSRSSVGMALGEVISETCCAYVAEIAKVEAWCHTNPMPLMRVLAEATSLSYPILRLNSIVQEMRRRWEGQANGGRLLHFLHMQLTQSSGSEEDQRLISLVLRRAALPYLEILKQWMREGVLRDPFGEFFVVENRWAAEASDNTDPSQSFNNRFIFKKEMVPGFINKDRMAKMAFVAGQYCCLVRECTGGSLPPIAAITEHEPLVWTDAEDLQRTVQRYYDSACGSIISLLFDAQHDLLGRLGSLKKFFLHGKGDWLVDFLDSADAMLQKSPQSVKTHSVRVLLQSAIAKSCPNDPYHGAIGCGFSNETLTDLVLSFNGEGEIDEDTVQERHRTGWFDKLRCVELLELKVEYQWPLTLVITPDVERHFNGIFRLLLSMKVSERSLHDAWWHRGVASPLAFSLKQQMIQFLRQFQFYTSHFVLERLWGKLLGKLAQADSVFAISTSIENFFASVEMELALSSLTRFQSLSKILSLVYQFCQIGYQSQRLTLQQSNEAVQRVGEEFWRALADLAKPQGSDYPHLVPLLTWIDFSRYYEIRNVFRVVHGAAAISEVEELRFSSSSTTRGGSTKVLPDRGKSHSKNDEDDTTN